MNKTAIPSSSGQLYLPFTVITFDSNRVTGSFALGSFIKIAEVAQKYWATFFQSIGYVHM
jgi:hypothetical protein